MNIDISYEIPNAKEYNNLRIISGLSPRNEEASKIGLKNSMFMITLRDSDKLVGMGRIIGDGGCCYNIVDIAVDPSYQGNGFGNLIMSQITKYLDDHVPKGSYVSLIADVPADKLYKKFGFDYSAPRSVGMAKRY
ncbi:ribosomal protein S18 acetylase RimI-like enzyme [Clostridium tetanomorphum]|uniref:GNAT family N-acetyltransferase n=1 Tax=Clostridium tetanomorphum TaxID=1553 RepID=UPI000446FA83|nr:GNAT family N-acetyltransferase [Clostridium tetanomorphum]KAJ49650.1 putative acetyltransferase [Clostridium tetanomorphum DSM 665]KAJ52416.1 putative acetyltransferase [Clostridium tetanomorphum DSM 665]MBP1864747.1 ribosomal protein S18 acetylase RimI-like enzyme [Clostridium tetanomorphum]NRS83924.1 ribosomal protein S18 acetylase RimI-like enzyme [Clostridium tetanomorphum]NRZ97143.1 ribosomal protein S18 acetylase RimI-like enzyme [Clostridium tetanomorphum]